MAHRKKKIGAQLVEDEEYQLRHERVAGIDVAKGKADVCTRLPPAREGGRRMSRTEEVTATVTAVTALAARLLADGVELVSMESTSDYWRIWFCVLEAAGLNAAAGELLPCPAAGRAAQDRPAGRAVAGPADRDGPAAAQLRAAGRDPGAARPDPDPAAAGARPHPGVAAAGKTAGRRAGEAVVGAVVAGQGQVRPRHREALAAGERDPRVLASLAAGQVRAGRAGIEAALEGMRYEEHHGRLTRIHLDHITFLDRSVAAIEDEIAACLDAIPAAQGIDAAGTRSADPGPGAAVLPAAERLAEIPGVSLDLARAIIAETGLDMTRFPTAGHLVSWAGLAPVARQSGPRSRKPGKGHGDSYLRGYCTQAATGAATTDTFPGERLRRLSRRLGGSRARCAVGRSILVIVWHLLASPEARYNELGPDWHARKTDTDRRTRSLLNQLRALHPDSDITITAA